MGKKSKRPVKKINVPNESKNSIETNISQKPVEKGFNPDYSSVIKDLKRIGTLAGTFFIILIVLSFIIK